MSNSSIAEILVVDDDDALRNSIALLLQSSGYVVSTAANGFEALLQLKKSMPAVVLSDLNMPEMSGFEFLSVVRRRFPQISVIAMSGAFETGDAVPGGVIADAFYPKGRSSPAVLLHTIAGLISTVRGRPVRRQDSAPVWIPIATNPVGNIPYVVVTCPDCLRSFPLDIAKELGQKTQETPCLFCPNTVRYIVDFPDAPSLSKEPASREHVRTHHASAGQGM
jgi:CheY-like chemotaxis protein